MIDPEKILQEFNARMDTTLDYLNKKIIEKDYISKDSVRVLRDKIKEELETTYKNSIDSETDYGARVASSMVDAIKIVDREFEKLEGGEENGG